MKRREFVYSVAASPGVVVLTSAPAVLAHAAVPSASASAAAPVVAHDVAPAAPVAAGTDAIGAGLELAGGFRVVAAYDVFHGALPFVLEGEGARFQIDVLRRTEGASGVFSTPHLTLFVHGAGGATEERGARALGLALERRVRAGASIPQLASFEERREQASAAVLHVDFVGHDTSAQSV